MPFSRATTTMIAGLRILGSAMGGRKLLLIAALAGLFATVFAETRVPLPFGFYGNTFTLFHTLTPIVPAVAYVHARSQGTDWLEHRSLQPVARIHVAFNLLFLAAAVIPQLATHWVLAGSVPTASMRNMVLGISLAILLSRILEARLASTLVVLMFVLEPMLVPFYSRANPPWHFLISATDGNMGAMAVSLALSVGALVLAHSFERFQPSVHALRRYPLQ